MAFLQRLGTLLRADAHGMVDALEDDSLLLRQHLRDAEAALAAKKARLDALEAEIRDLDRATERLDERRAELERDVDLALDQERDDLARFAVQQLLPARERRAETASRRDELERRRAELEEVVRGQEEQLEDLRLRVREALERRTEDGALGSRALRRRFTDEDVELELLRRRTERNRDTELGAEPSADPPEGEPS